MPPQPNGAGNPQDQRVALQAHKPPDLTAAPPRREDDEVEDERNYGDYRRSRPPDPPYPPYPPYPSQPQQPPPINPFTYVWQIVATLAAAAAVGAWVWMFNVAVEIRYIPTVKEQLNVITDGQSLTRRQVERDSNRLTAIETELRFLSRLLVRQINDGSDHEFRPPSSSLPPPPTDRRRDDKVP